jgi:hypothetical protein
MRPATAKVRAHGQGRDAVVWVLRWESEVTQ